MNALKFFVFTLFLFLIATFQSCAELRLSVSGKLVDAKVENVMVEIDTEKRKETGLYLVYYQYVVMEGDNRGEYKGQYSVDREVAAATEKGDAVSIIYLPSQPMTHRVVGHRNYFWVIIFFVFLFVISINGWYVWKQAQGDVARSRR